MFFFLIPAHPTQLKTSPALLDWKTTQDSVAWGIILLLGGGFAMAEGTEVSGLSSWMGSQLTVLEKFSPFFITLIVCIIALMLTEVASNTATCTILLPVVKRMVSFLEWLSLYLNCLIIQSFIGYWTESESPLSYASGDPELLLRLHASGCFGYKRYHLWKCQDEE